MNFRYCTITIIFSLFFFLHSGLYAQTDSTVQIRKQHWWDKYRPDSLINMNMKLLPVPTIQSSPESGLRFGVALQYFFNTAEKKQKDSMLKTRNSNAYLELLYSTRKQLLVESYVQMFTPGEKYFIRNRVGFADNNERIWGFGNNTVSNKDYETVSYSRWYFQPYLFRQIKNNFFAGININYSKTYNVDEKDDADTSFLKGQPGESGSTVIGIGPSILWDKRDHVLEPRRGWYGELSVTFHTKTFGGNYTYTQYNFDARKYFSLGDSSCIALQGIANLSSGTVPWREQAKMGSTYMMRGYFGGRFRDNQYVAGQVEYRKPIHRLVTAAVFASAGEVQHEMSDISFNNIRYAGGVGIRILANKAKRIFVRFDYAITSDKTSGFYMKIGEAF